MRLISIVAICLLTSCNSFLAHKDELKPMAHDMVDEEIESLATKICNEELKGEDSNSK